MQRFIQRASIVVNGIVCISFNTTIQLLCDTYLHHAVDMLIKLLNAWLIPQNILLNHYQVVLGKTNYLDMVTSRFPPFVLILKHLNWIYILQC